MLLDLMQLDHIDPILKKIATETEKELRVQFKVTSLFRPGDSGVHGYGRGLDWSCKNPEFGVFVENYINNRWQYDPARPEKKCCMYHKTVSGEYHLHLQSHPNTMRR